ncbi:MAG: hypothetical protein ACYS5W_20805, partial [Planctomycetota bacterium]
MSEPTHQELHAPQELPPHQNPAQWGQLIDALEIPVILVVISASMSSRLKQEFTAEDIWQE